MPAPANDNIANAIDLAAGTTSYSGDSTGATTEANENRSVTGSTDWSQLTYNTVWFRWTAPSTASAQIDTIGSSYDTYLNVLKAKTGVPDPVTVTDATTSLDVVASDDDAGGGGTSKVIFTPIAGRIYYIQISGFGASNFGPYTLRYPLPAGAAAATAPPPRRSFYRRNAHLLTR